MGLELVHRSDTMKEKLVSIDEAYKELLIAILPEASIRKFSGEAVTQKRMRCFKVSRITL